VHVRYTTKKVLRTYFPRMSGRKRVFVGHVADWACRTEDNCHKPISANVEGYVTVMVREAPSFVEDGETPYDSLELRAMEDEGDPNAWKMPDGLAFFFVHPSVHANVAKTTAIDILCTEIEEAENPPRVQWSVDMRDYDRDVITKFVGAVVRAVHKHKKGVALLLPHPLTAFAKSGVPWTQFAWQYAVHLAILQSLKAYVESGALELFFCEQIGVRSIVYDGDREVEYTPSSEAAPLGRMSISYTDNNAEMNTAHAWCNEFSSTTRVTASDIQTFTGFKDVCVPHLEDDAQAYEARIEQFLQRYRLDSCVKYISAGGELPEIYVDMMHPLVRMHCDAITALVPGVVIKAEQMRVIAPESQDELLSKVTEQVAATSLD